MAPNLPFDGFFDACLKILPTVTIVVLDEEHLGQLPAPRGQHLEVRDFALFKALISDPEQKSGHLGSRLDSIGDCGGFELFHGDEYTAYTQKVKDEMSLG